MPELNDEDVEKELERLVIEHKELSESIESPWNLQRLTRHLIVTAEAYVVRLYIELLWADVGSFVSEMTAMTFKTETG